MTIRKFYPIELEFQHGQLVFKVRGDEYYITSSDLLDLLDGQRVNQIFHDLDPAVIYADWDNFDFVAKYVALCEKDYSLEERAEYLATAKERLEAWERIRAGSIRQIKDRNPANFEAAVRGAKERIPNKKGENNVEEKKERNETGGKTESPGDQGSEAQD